MAKPRVRVVVLAAGAGSRFGGRKLEARLAGRPILQHVLDALAAAGHEDPVVVLPPGSSLEAQVAWRRAARVVNPEPERGLSSSLQLGWTAATATEPAPEAVLVVLGDQPRVGETAIAALLDAPLDPARPIVAPRFADSDARNPVRIEVSAAGLVAGASGDRGLGPLLDAEPDRVRWLDLAGDNPDIDRREDLAAAIEAAWAERVRRNRAQIERLQATGAARRDSDHYAPVVDLFRDDPRRRGDTVLDAVLELARANDTWLDVGAGAGRFAFPLALAIREVIALDPSAAMVAALEAGVREHQLSNVRIVEGRWPAAAATFAPFPCADVALIANVGHDVEAIGPFVDALDAAVRRSGVAVMHESAPASTAAPAFRAVHGEARELLPALGDLVELLEARGSNPTVDLVDRAHTWQSRDALLAFLRRQTWVDEGTPGDHRLQEHLDREGVEEAPSRIGIVRWSPRSGDRT